MTKSIDFKVQMSCSGCSGAITRILSKIDGVESIDANIDTKDVRVTCRDDVESSLLLEALINWSKSSGKAVELISK